MLIFKCPYCDVIADETELRAGGEAHIKRCGPRSSDDDFERSSTKKDPLKYVDFSPSLNNPSVDPLIGFSNKVAL